MTSPPALPSRIIEVAVPLNLERTFHYLVPEPLVDAALPGRRVLAPFGKRLLTGYILSVCAETPYDKLKPIRAVLDSEPLWTDGELEFFRWVASYYLHPLGEVLKTALPAGINLQSRKGLAGGDDLSGGRTIRREQYYRTLPDTPLPRLGGKAAEVLDAIRTAGEISGAELRGRFGGCLPQVKRLLELELIACEERELYRDPFRNSNVIPDTPRLLNGHQQAALLAITQALDHDRFSPFLLHGVTGSGKTEVYLQAISHALDKGGAALVLVPEIALTPQLTGRFRARFRCGIAILHSGLSDGERYDEWRRIRRGEARIVIGARSAIFAPLERIGIIVVDEEHEGSFKQGDGLRYNARDLALVRGRMERAVVLLGSATPQVTSLHAARQGRLALLELPERVANRPLPQIEMVPMKGIRQTISAPLAQALADNLARGEQSIVFLNRRGFATFLVCSACSQPLTCPNCTVTLTYHRRRGQSVCHYCDFALPAPGTCPACGGHELQELGAGTERLEHELEELFPEARILRMDSDTTSSRGSHERLLARVAEGNVDILVGTQMIAKGHDFPGVTLVGVVNADASLGMPDFRAAERTFQLLSQVIGRAGRGELPGRVVLQALSDSHYALQCAASHDGPGFYRQELEFREEVGYPPFCHLVALGFSGTAEAAVADRAAQAARELAALREARRLRVELLGPAPAPLYRLRGRFRRQILLKSADRTALRALVTAWRSACPPAATVRDVVDIDPVDML